MSRARAKGVESHHKGLIGEAHFLEFASERGWHIYRGLDGHTPCDYVVDIDGELLRVEVKRTEFVVVKDGASYARLVTKFDSKNFDHLFVSTPSGNYFIPAEACPVGTLWLKVGLGAYGAGKYERYRV